MSLRRSRLLGWTLALLAMALVLLWQSVMWWLIVP